MTAESASPPAADPGFVHEALMYRGEAELRDAVRDFLGAASAADEPVLLALPAATWERVETASAMPTSHLPTSSWWGATPVACCG